MRYVRLGVTIAALGLAACKRGDTAASADRYAGILTFDSASIRLVGRDTVRLNVELAESDAEQAMGLMERRMLAPDAGMLFIYSSIQPESSAFWMFRTRIPLDIAFIDSLGTIRTVQTMAPCDSPLAQGCPDFPAGAPYLAALEVNAGYFAQHHLGVGDRVLLSDTIPRRLTTHPTP